MGESINKWIRSDKRIQWNGSDPNRYYSYYICHHNKQQVQYVQYLFIINKHTQ